MNSRQAATTLETYRSRRVASSRTASLATSRPFQLSKKMVNCCFLGWSWSRKWHSASRTTSARCPVGARRRQRALRSARWRPVRSAVPSSGKLLLAVQRDTLSWAAYTKTKAEPDRSTASSHPIGRCKNGPCSRLTISPPTFSSPHPGSTARYREGCTTLTELTYNPDSEQLFCFPYDRRWEECFDSDTYSDPSP